MEESVRWVALLGRSFGRNGLRRDDISYVLNGFVSCGILLMYFVSGFCGRFVEIFLSLASPVVFFVIVFLFGSSFWGIR